VCSSDLDKFGNPFLVGKFDRNDNKSRAVLERAFKLSTKIGGIVINRETQVELVQAAASQTGEAFERFHAVCNREMSKLILGQSLSAEAQPTGMGSGTSNLQGEVREDIREWDELKLCETLREQLFVPFLRINGLRGNCSIQWGGKKAVDAKTIADALAALKNAGLRLAEKGLDELSQIFSLPIERDDQAPATGLPALPGQSKKMIPPSNRAGGGSAVLDDAQRGDCGREGWISMAA
jgi:phage gp29-like protein